MNTSFTTLTHYLDTLEHKKHTTTSTNTSIGQIHTKTVSNIVSNTTYANEPKHQLSYLMVSLNHYQYLTDCSYTSPWISYPYHHGHIRKEDITRSTTCYGSLCAGTLDSSNLYQYGKKPQQKNYAYCLYTMCIPIGVYQKTLSATEIPNSHPKNLWTSATATTSHKA